MTDYVDIYYGETLCFRRIAKDDVDGVIDGWMMGGQEKGKVYDRSKFSTRPTQFGEGTPPIAGMTEEAWAQFKEKERRDAADIDCAKRTGFLVLEGPNLMFPPGFLRMLNIFCKIDRNLSDEELLYRMMIAVREFSPDLPDPDFLAVRRVMVQKAARVRERWRNTHPDEKKETMEEHERTLSELRKRWAGGFKEGQKQDLLTYIHEEQLNNARKVVADDKNFFPELVMWWGRGVTVDLVGPPDPMTQAIAMVKQAKPEGYSFASESWQAKLDKKYEKWGDIAKIESKTEGFMQVSAENNGPVLNRTFLIDRVAKVLILDSVSNLSRMPKFWGVADRAPPRDATASGAYA